MKIEKTEKKQKNNQQLPQEKNSTPTILLHNTVRSRMQGYIHVK